MSSSPRMLVDSDTVVAGEKRAESQEQEQHANRERFFLCFNAESAQHSIAPSVCTLQQNTDGRSSSRHVTCACASDGDS
jgi:hypothetical protein